KILHNLRLGSMGVMGYKIDSVDLSGLTLATNVFVPGTPLGGMSPSSRDRDRQRRSSRCAHDKVPAAHTLRRPSDRDLHPRRALDRGRPLQCSPVINPVFEDRNLVGYAFELLVAERQQAIFSIRERLGDVSGYRTDNIMGFGRVFHSRRDIDCAAI